MDPQAEINALKRKIEALEAKNEGLERKNEEFEAENRDLRSRLTEIGSPEGKDKDDIRDRIRENQSKIIANQGTITANTNLITEYQRTINATITTSGKTTFYGTVLFAS